jgi:hypothetical protein
MILWDHRRTRICGPSLTETSLCGAYLYFFTQRLFTTYIAGLNRLHVSASASHQHDLIKNIKKYVFNVAYFILLCVLCTTDLSK